MIEVGKKYRTRDGRNVRILATDLRDGYWPIVAVVPCMVDCEGVFLFCANGRHVSDDVEHGLDLFEDNSGQPTANSQQSPAFPIANQEKAMTPIERRAIERAIHAVEDGGWTPEQAGTLLTLRQMIADSPQIQRPMTPLQINSLVNQLGPYEGDYEDAIVRAVERHYGIGGIGA